MELELEMKRWEIQLRDVQKDAHVMDDKISHLKKELFIKKDILKDEISKM
jgi:hypothetical protein